MTEKPLGDGVKRRHLLFFAMQEQYRYYFDFVRAVIFKVCLSVSLLLTASSTGQSVSDTLLETLSKSSYWLRLGHYEKRFLGGYRSRVEGSDFFFSPEGRTNPYFEMKATLDAFSKKMEVGYLKQHPQCAFPERYRFLKEKLKLQIEDVPCPKLKEYLEKLNPDSATLVFSSAYPHNPGSMFGHTFLKINSKSKDLKKQDLLDWGISYAAQVAEDENGLAFVVLGLTGGYRGEFSLLPYYSKVNEYVKNESRDVWEYELNLTPEDTLRMVKNIWEVETNGFFSYYFLDENCSYQLLAFLEVAKPEWKLTNFPIYVIPGETVKKVADIEGAIRNVKYRPSLQKKMTRNYENLSPSQKEIFQRLISYQTEPSDTPDARVLDSVSEYLLYVKKKRESDLNEKESALFRAALLKRSTLGKPPTEFPAPESLQDSSRPDLAHDTYRIALSSGFESRPTYFPKTQVFQDVQFKFAFHDLLNSDLGYTPFSQVDFPALTIRYYERSRHFRLENLHILSVVSLSPLQPLDKHPSWTMRLEVVSPKDLTCDHCQLAHFDIGGGASLGFLKGRGIFYSMGIAQVEAGNSLRLGYRFIPKWQMGTLINFFESYKIQLQASWNWDLFQRDRRTQFFDFQWNQSLALSRNWEVRFLTQVIPTPAAAESSFLEAKLSMLHYF